MEQQSSQERNRIIDAGLVAGLLVAWRSWYSLQGVWSARLGSLLAFGLRAARWSRGQTGASDEMPSAAQGFQEGRRTL